jgi:hypothetical protein
MTSDPFSSQLGATGEMRSSDVMDIIGETPRHRVVNGPVAGAKTHSSATEEAVPLAGPRIELGTERESLLQVLDEDANFRGQPAAGRPYGKDWHRPLKLGQ